MKMTMHIDESLLKRVMENHGYDSKTETVEMALRELDRKARMKEFGTKGLGLSPED
jgi:Arc/MetJ family transcription regulator